MAHPLGGIQPKAQPVIIKEPYMSKLGVVTCQILELEFAHLLLNDPDVAEIWVIHDEFSRELIQVLEESDLKPVHGIATAHGFDTQGKNGLAVLVRVMKVGLHSNIQNLRTEVASAVRQIAPFVDAAFLGYGLCGNALKNLEDLFPYLPIPVSLPMENEDPVDDCVGLIIGGRENYYGEQCVCAGTMFMNPGFSRHWKNILSLDIPEKLLHKQEKIMKRFMGSYKRCLLLPTPVLNEDELRRNTLEFSEKYNLEIETRPGTLALLETAWKIAKTNAGRAAPPSRHPG